MFFDFNGFWRENRVTRLTAKFKCQLWCNKKAILKEHDEIESSVKKLFLKAHLVKKLLNFDFWISRHFVAFFRNKSAFQNALSLKTTELFKKFFQIWFYPVKLFQYYLFVVISWNSNFSVNLVTSFSRQGSKNSVKSFSNSRDRERFKLYRNKIVLLSPFNQKMLSQLRSYFKIPMKLYSCAPTNSEISLSPSFETSCCNYKQIS